MATWEDGPEYAPLQPPDQFTVPDVPPLSIASPPEEPPPVPGDRPRFGDPDQPVAALATLDPDAGGPGRDPRLPFDVESQTITDGSNRGGAWGAAHWRPPVGPPAGTGQPGAARPIAGGPGAATPVQGGSPTPSPTQPNPAAPMAVQASPASSVAGQPAPGTPAWFGPGVRSEQQPQRPSTWRASPPGVLIMLILSVFWFPAPFTFTLAFILTARARYARQPLLIAFTIVGGLVLAIATISTLTNYGDLSTWYSRAASWSLVGSVLMLILVLVLTKGELDRQFGKRGSASRTGNDRPPQHRQ